MLAGWCFLDGLQCGQGRGEKCLHYAEWKAVCAEPWAGVGCESRKLVGAGR